MSSFYHTASSSAKVVPLCLSSPSPLLITQLHNNKAMDSSAHTDLLITPVGNHSKLLLHDDLIKPMILTFQKKIMLNQALINTPADHQSNPNGGDKEQDISSSAYQASASSEGQLWPKVTEVDDPPSKPPYQDATQQVISQSAYLFPKQSELIDRPPSPSNEKSEKKQVIREPAFLYPEQTELNINRPLSPSRFKSEKIRNFAYPTEVGNRPSSPPYNKVIKPQVQVIRAPAYQSPNEAELDPWKAISADDEGMGKKMEVIRDAAYHNNLLEMKESYRSPPRARLSRVVEESESFSRREFGANVLNYMSTHSSANHAANLSTHTSYNHANHSDFSYKHLSYHHNNQSNFSYNHSSYHSGNFMASKSAPAGTATRTGSTFALFRRGSSDGANLGPGRRVVYRRPKSRKPKSLAHRLLWPLLKIRNGYVGCMMGLEGAGDLSGMAQGGTYATKARYFAEVPLSKTDSRNHG